MRRVWAAFKRTTSVDRVWLASKALAALWAASLVLVTPPALAAVWAPFALVGTMTLVVIGAIVSSTGLVVGALGEPTVNEYHSALRRAHTGYAIETFGLGLILGGVGAYIVAQVGIIVLDGQWLARTAQVIAFLWIGCMVTARLIQVRRQGAREERAAQRAGIVL